MGIDGLKRYYTRPDKMEQPIKVKRNGLARAVNKKLEQEANRYYQQEAKEKKN